MFGLGNKRRRVRSDTFAPNRIRGAAIAGLGMLAWQWWRKRQASNQPGGHPSQSFTESPRTPATGAF
jgi:uncharacterized membrane protein YebE (DUF533 family)